jgi:hypothetical protein
MGEPSIWEVCSSRPLAEEEISVFGSSISWQAADMKVITAGKGQIQIMPRTCTVQLTGYGGLLLSESGVQECN